MDKEREHIIADKPMLRVARVTSMVFTPFSIPFLSFLVLFLFSYLRIMPIQYKLIVLGIVYCFTILTPTITIFLFRKINGFARQELSERKKRYVPILLTIISYVFCLLMMRKLNIPWYMTGIILASLVVSVICIAVNLKWKLSEHMAGIGGVIGGLVSFSALFGYNPVAWLCLFILIAGILGSARIILGHHTLGEVLSGFTVGLVAALLVLHPVSNLLFRVFLFKQQNKSYKLIIMNFPQNLKYTNEHEWIRVEGDIAYVGITDYAQEQLGDIVFVDIPTVGETLEAGEVFGTIEVVKTISDLFLPVAGEVIELNEALEENPELVNKDPYGEGWLIKVKPEDIKAVEDLLDAEAYKAVVNG